MNDGCDTLREARRTRVVQLVLALLAVLGSGWLSAAEKDAYDTLKSAKMFAIGGVGFAGTTSDGEKAFRTLQKEKDAAAHFAALLGEANTEGQLYALLGLKMANPAEFERRLPAYLKSKKTITFMSGCMLSNDMSVAVVATHIQKGRYR